jgi:hypothetical protein
MTKVLVHKLRTNISKTYDIITGTQVEHTNIFCNICYQIIPVWFLSIILPGSFREKYVDIPRYQLQKQSDDNSLHCHLSN